MNQGLILITPVILVRLLSVEDFGRYREFLLYVTVLMSFAGFGVNSSLLRFVPHDPKAGWRFVDQAIVMTFVSSLIVVGGMAGLNYVMDGRLVGDYALTVSLYVLLLANLDFWEFLWLAEKRSYAVIGYTTGRLVARIVVVTTTAALTRDVNTIIWALICMEAVRIVISAIGWRVRSRAALKSKPRWREQLEYCLPFGGALILITLNKSMGGLFVAKLLGPVALAHYAIGIYVQPVITVLRNSLSDVLLPEMVSRSHEQQADRLELWRRSTVASAIALAAAGVVLARFADILVVTLFSENYRPAVEIFQLYLLVFVRESLDFGIPLRALNQTTPILRGNAIAIVINAALMLILMPVWGVLGAVAAFLISRVVEGAYMGWRMMRAYDVTLSDLAPWGDLLKVVIAAAVASASLYSHFWTERLGLAGVVVGGAVYVAIFTLVLAWQRVPEAMRLIQLMRSAPWRLLRRSR